MPVHIAHFFGDKHVIYTISLSKVNVLALCVIGSPIFLYYIFCKVENLIRFARRLFPELSRARSRLVHHFYLDSRFLIYKGCNLAWAVCLIEHHNNPVSKIQICFLYLIIRMWLALCSFGSIVRPQQNCRIFPFFLFFFFFFFNFLIWILWNFSF